MYLGISPTVANWNAEKTEFSLVFDELPFADFVELPATLSKLHYCNLLCGVLQGALESLQMKVECSWAQDTLSGGSANELRVVLKEFLSEDKFSLPGV